jgi:hypothetical protein
MEEGRWVDRFQGCAMLTLALSKSKDDIRHVRGFSKITPSMPVLKPDNLLVK